jgi:hypothetical protein
MALPGSVALDSSDQSTLLFAQAQNILVFREHGETKQRI